MSQFGRQESISSFEIFFFGGSEFRDMKLFQVIFHSSDLDYSFEEIPSSKLTIVLQIG